MKIVKFRKGWGRYNKGEIAGFEAATADKLIAKGVARQHAADVVAAPDGAMVAAAMADARMATRMAAQLEQTRQAQEAAILNDRAAALDARQAELDAQAADLEAMRALLADTAVQHAADGAASAGEADADPAADVADSLPKQGKK